MNRVPTLTLASRSQRSRPANPALTRSQTVLRRRISNAASALSAVDYHVRRPGQSGRPFQIDSGRIAEEKATTADVRDYAHLMVVSHIPVVDGLNSILQRKQTAGAPRDVAARRLRRDDWLTQGRHRRRLGP